MMGGWRKLILIVIAKSLSEMLNMYRKDYLITWAEIFNTDNKLRNFLIYLSVELLCPFGNQMINVYTEQTQTVATDTIKAKL